jgi:hypothetical protein
VRAGARRLAWLARNKLACSDGWFALAVLVTILVPVVAIFAYWSMVTA